MEEYVKNLDKNLQIIILQFCLPQDARERYLILTNIDKKYMFYEKIKTNICIKHYPEYRSLKIDNRNISELRLKLPINMKQYYSIVHCFYNSMYYSTTISIIKNSIFHSWIWNSSLNYYYGH